MYMGVLVGGADLASGLLAMEISQKNQRNISVIFKDMSASFFKRAEAETVFICNEGE